MAVLKEMKISKLKGEVGILEDVVQTLDHAEVFILSRQKMHPDGQRLYRDCKLKAMMLKELKVLELSDLEASIDETTTS